MKKFFCFLLLTTVCFSTAFAGVDGAPGISGCDGGTNPSPDGKFYLPGTQEECNPGTEDLKKLKDVEYADRNIAECAKLLPSDGKQYEVNLHIIVSKERLSTGKLIITDNSNCKLSDKENAKVKPYIDCVKHQIK